MNAITKGYQDVPMTRRRAQLLEEYASKLADMLEAAPNDKDLAEWVQSKVDRAAAAIQSAYHYLDQDDESDLEKARVLKYDYRRPSKTRFNKKTGKREWDYFYTKKHGARVIRGAFEAGAAFRMTWKGRKGHFHIHHVKGDQVFITHDSRPDMEPIPVQADELRALLERQHKREVDQHLKRKTRKVEEIKRRAHRGGLGLALHRLRQAAAQAGVTLPEQYQRKPKKTRAKVAETQAPTFQGAFNKLSEIYNDLPPPKGRRAKDTRVADALKQLSDEEFKTVDEYLEEQRGIETTALDPQTQTFVSTGRRPDPVIHSPIGRAGGSFLRERQRRQDPNRRSHESVEVTEVNDLFEIGTSASGEIIVTPRERLEEDVYRRTLSAMGRLDVRAAWEPALGAFSTKDKLQAERLMQKIRDLIETTQTTPRDQLKDTAQQIIEDANQEHGERHEEHQEITRFELGEHVHTKTGAKLYTAKQTERVDRDEYFRRVEIAKKYKGRYERRYVRGFVFKSAEDARAYALEVEGAAQEAPETSAETVTPHDEHPGADNFETMPEVEAPAREHLIETAEQATAPSSPLDIDQANAQDTLTENRTRAPESKAADKALIESARELAKTSERGEEIKSALVDLMNAQQLKRYKRATGDTRARAEDMIEKRREARERLRAATSGEGINNFETMPEVEAQPKKRSGPNLNRYKRALSLAKKAERLDKLKNNRRSKASREADQALIDKAQEILDEDLSDLPEVRDLYGKPSTTWTYREQRKAAISSAMNMLKRNQRAKDPAYGGAEKAREDRSEARAILEEQAQERVDQEATPEELQAREDREAARNARETAKQEAREAQEARQYQKQTFTPEIQTAISYPVHGERRNRTKKSFESHFKTRKDGAIFRISKGEHIGNLAYAIIQNLPEEIREYKIGMDDLRSLIAGEIREAIEQRQTPAELKDRIGSVITKRAQDNAVRRKEEITGTGEGAALREMKRNIKTLSGDGHFDHQGRGGPRSYVGLGAIEKTLSMSERLSDLYVDAIFRQALPPELERFKMPVTRFSAKAADQVAGAFANKYETVGEIRDNISTIREQMRATIKSAVNKTADALVKRPNTLDMIKHSHEMITEQRDTQRQKAAEAARALAQYTDDPQAHLAEIQELERQSDQAIAEQMEINREFADAYIHEASDLVERALETTKGEVIDNVMSVKTPKHAGKFTASVQGKANRKLMARIFNEVFEQVTREIRDEPIERGEKHPRNIADTVKKPSKTPAQFRSDIERADEEKRARKLAEREARRARRVQKSARPLITYRAQLIQTVERLTA